MVIKVEDYSVLNLNKDPFSTAPDPEFIYQSRQHFGTLQLLECSIKKEKGICVVLGSPGTGKTSICRQLYRKISFEKKVKSQVLYAHYYDNSEQLIREIADIFNINGLMKADDLYNRLVHNFLADGNTIALIVDNGHMIPEFCLSVFNRLASLECKGRNFFQIVVFANKEFRVNINANPDFESRIVNYRTLGPFNFSDTRQMIAYRLTMAGNKLNVKRDGKQKSFFSYPALFAIYLATGGSPRKIVVLCHRCIVTMLLNETVKAGWFLVRKSAKRVLQSKNVFPDSAISAAILLIPLLFVVFVIGSISDKDFSSFINTANSVVKDAGEEKVVNDSNNGIEDISEIPESEVVSISPEVYISDVKDKVDSVNDVPVNKEIINNNESVTTADIMKPVPDILGIVEVKRSDTLLVMLERVYGHSRLRYKNPVVKVNKHILNINSLEIGDKIHFPTIVAVFSEVESDTYWIKVKSAEKLNNAVDYVRKWSLKKDRIKIIPYYSKDSGLHFDIVIKKIFKDKENALNYLNSLPESIGKNPSIIQFTFKKNTYFANPYDM